MSTVGAIEHKWGRGAEPEETAVRTVPVCTRDELGPKSQTRLTGTTPRPRRAIVIALIVGCAFFMERLDSTMIAVSIPAMAKSLAENPPRLNLVIATYLLSLAVFIPVSGWIADRLGARVVPSAMPLCRGRC
jgi:hypothetical protein